MDKKKYTPSKQEIVEVHDKLTPPTPTENPNQLVYNFLKENKLRMKVEAVDPSEGFIGNGFLLVDRPTLKVIFEKI